MTYDLVKSLNQFRLLAGSSNFSPSDLITRKRQRENFYSKEKNIKIRGSPTFDSVKYVKEVVTLCTMSMPTQFWSTQFSLVELDQLMELDQKWVFDQFKSGSKMGFRTNWVTLSSISKRNWGGSKVSRHTYASRENLLHIFHWIKSWTPAY